MVREDSGRIASAVCCVSVGAIGMGGESPIRREMPVWSLLVELVVLVFVGGGGLSVLARCFLTGAVLVRRGSPGSSGWIESVGRAASPQSQGSSQSVGTVRQKCQQNLEGLVDA